MKYILSLLIAMSFLPVSGEIIFRQDFENPAYFENLTNGYTAKLADGSQWHIGGANDFVKCSDEQAANGKHSLKFTHSEVKFPYPAGLLAAPYDGSFEAEFWFLREPELRFVAAVAGPVGDRNWADLAAIGIFDNNYQFVYWNHDTGKWARSSLKCPAETWIKATIRVDQEKKTITYLVTIDDKEETLGSCKLPDRAKLRKFEFRRNNSKSGASVYFDDIVIRTAASAAVALPAAPAAKPVVTPAPAARIELKPSALDDAVAKLQKPWKERPRRLTQKDYIGLLHYYAARFPNDFKLEIRGKTPKGLPVYLAVMTDRNVPDNDKNVILLTAFHAGGERTATAGLLAFAEWLMGGSADARESLRKNIVLLMPIGNPEAFFLAEGRQSRNIDPYALGRGNRVNLDTLELKVPEDGPEVYAYRSVADEYRPDFHFDVHGTALHFNGHLQPPSIGRAGSNSSLRSWDDRIVRTMIDAGVRAGWGYQQFDVDSQRLTWGPAMGEKQQSFCEMGSPYFAGAMYGYFRHHTLTFVMESTWCGMVVEPIKGILKAANAGLTRSPVDGFPVNRIKTNYALHLEAWGADRATRRDSRVKLWTKQQYFLVGCAYPETTNYRMAVAAYGKEGQEIMTGAMKDSGRWGQTSYADFLNRIAGLDYVDAGEVKKFIDAAPPSVTRIMFEKGAFDLAQPVPELDSGLAMMIQLPTSENEILHLALNGKPLAPDARDGYQAWPEDGFLNVRVNIPPERAGAEKIFILTCLWNPARNLAADFGYLPNEAARQWIDRELAKSGAAAELEEALKIEDYYRKNKETYIEK